MRRLFTLLLCLTGSLATYAAGPDVLATAVDRFAAESNEWAYTQKTVSRDNDGKLRREVVMRYDPSRPEDEQFTPLLINGQEPTESQIRKYRRSQEKHRQQTDPQALSQLLDVEAARRLREEGDAVFYQVPLKRAEGESIDPDKFYVVVRVNKQEPALEEMWVRLREPVRTRAILQLETGEANLHFKSADGDSPPTLTALRATGRGSIAFIKVGGSYELSRSNFVHVRH
ncbi:hypothetical protein K0B96_15470 [Horticoccus luteus]|uniref:Uncharacterized protein n=1 Tax=Horticoccus luteus TaxID=2862869 RepID=A0A8F9XG21_9BACT|nr:hypothetical protein [Horticoccus luteus]QYM78682.1 hypothetical protein K0B96_15470 [Horticoccus luteus]